jgi:hypothetical protein
VLVQILVRCRGQHTSRRQTPAATSYCIRVICVQHKSGVHGSVQVSGIVSASMVSDELHGLCGQLKAMIFMRGVELSRLQAPPLSSLPR